jgi:hypothetical protein
MAAFESCPGHPVYSGQSRASKSGAEHSKVIKEVSSPAQLAGSLVHAASPLRPNEESNRVAMERAGAGGVGTVPGKVPKRTIQQKVSGRPYFHESGRYVVRPPRFERGTFCSGGKRSIQTELRAQTLRCEAQTSARAKELQRTEVSLSLNRLAECRNSALPFFFTT